MASLIILSFQAGGDKEIKSEFNKGVSFHTSLGSWEAWFAQPRT